MRVTESVKKTVAARQDFKCANSISPIASLTGYNCLLGQCRFGTFDEAGYEIDHIAEVSVTGDNSIENLQALCPMCHVVKTRRFMQQRKTEKAQEKAAAKAVGGGGGGGVKEAAVKPAQEKAAGGGVKKKAVAKTQAAAPEALALQRAPVVSCSTGGDDLKRRGTTNSATPVKDSMLVHIYTMFLKNTMPTALDWSADGSCVVLKDKAKVVLVLADPKHNSLGAPAGATWVWLRNKLCALGFKPRANTSRKGEEQWLVFKHKQFKRGDKVTVVAAVTAAAAARV